MPGALDKVAAFLVLLGLAVVVGALRHCGQETVSGSVAVVDGDSLRLAGLEIRLAGLDAPELRQVCFRDGAPYPCGEVARSALLRMVAGSPVTCRIDGRDRYGRSLGRCSIDGDDIGSSLVAQGLAVAYGAYGGEEADARRRRLGLWAGVFDSPSEWRKSHPVPHRPRS